VSGDPLLREFAYCGVDFLTYRGDNQHIAAVDTALNVIIRCTRRDSRGFLGAIYARLPLLDTTGRRLVRAYEENCDPVTKARRIRDAHTEILTIIDGQIHSFREFQEKVDALRLVYSYVNPPFIASAFAFIVDQIGPSSEALEQLDERQDGELPRTFDVLLRLISGWFAGRFEIADIAQGLRKQGKLLFQSTGDQAADTRWFAALVTGLTEKQIEKWPSFTLMLQGRSGAGSFKLGITAENGPDVRAVVWITQLKLRRWRNPYRQMFDSLKEAETAAKRPISKIVLYRPGDGNLADLEAGLAAEGLEVALIAIEGTDDLRKAIINELADGLTQLDGP
jgi:hypothetical protein